jgi:hypothetical protein
MLRKTLILTAIVVGLCAIPASGILADPAFIDSGSIDPIPTGAITMPQDRASDSYAIYSLLMPGAPFDSMGSLQSQSWAIADTTVSISDMNPAIPPEGQLKPPDDHPKRFQEAVRDFEARKYRHIQLMDQFHLSQPHQLMNAAQVAELRQAKTSVAADSALQSKYASYPGVTFFSEVYFSSNHNAALVYMNNWCAQLCATGQWIYLEKHSGSWVRRSGIYEKMSWGA